MVKKKKTKEKHNFDIYKKKALRNKRIFNTVLILCIIVLAVIIFLKAV